MRGDVDLIQQAASGSVAAHLGLVDLAIAAGADGSVRRIEALIAAETWARLAATNGAVPENRTLVGVLLARADFEAERCAPYNVQWYEGEARRVLKLLAALDDHEARQVLDELGPTADNDNHHEPDVAVHTTLAAAARGDLAALASLAEEALDLLKSGGSDPLEALTAGELYARLGAASGDVSHMRRLAGIMLKRAEYEYREGSHALGDSATTEATILLSILVDCGDQSMGHWLNLLVNDSPMAPVAVAASYRPTILKFIETKGAC